MKNSILCLLLALLCATASAAPKVGARDRQRIEQTLARIVEREVAGTKVRLKGVTATRKLVRIDASVDLSYYPFRPDNVQAIYDSVRLLLPAEFAKARLAIYTDRREINDLIPRAYQPSAQRARTTPFINDVGRPLVRSLSAPATPQKGLSGRHIALWQSHGRYFDQKESRWRWQRSQLWETCEDLYTQSFVLPYLVPMLENAGANVLLPRERDVQTHEALADNDDPRQYLEQNGAENWQAGGPGFAHRQQVYQRGENPFRQGTTRRARTLIDGEQSRAVWTVDIPEKGEYAVYVSYESTPASADDALYTVHALGGDRLFAVNQRMGGGTWICLGHFAFDAGVQQAVSLSNRSATAGRSVSADAVKIGGGFGNITRTVCDSIRTVNAAQDRRKGVAAPREYLDETSGYPRFCEGARYWLQWAGFGEEIYSPKNNGDDYKDDFMSRALWVNALMGGSPRLPEAPGLRIPIDMAFAFHSDAGVRPGDEVVGTLGICCTRDNDGKFEGGADRYRSRDLTDLVQTQVVDDIRRTFEPAWVRRGLWNRSYYEARVPSAPTMLLELLSHQNFADMRYGHDPRFKFLVSRAIYKGILRYISSQYDLPCVVQPLAVEAFSAEFEGPQGLRLRWSPVVDSLEATAAPMGYVVYTRIGDGGFDCGRRVENPTFLAEQEPGVVYSYRVTAINDGGESFPSETLAACRVADERGRVLIVNGFDRVCAPVSQRCDSLAGFYGELDPGVPDRRDISFIGSQRVFDLCMARSENDKIALGACANDFETDVLGGNTFDYPYVHGRAAAAAGYSFCSASAKAVERGEVSLAEYPAVDLILGKQRTTVVGRGVNGSEYRAFTPELQRALRQMLAAGGALFVSGSYLVTDLWNGSQATDDDRTFAREVLHIDFDGALPTDKNRVRVVTANVGFTRGDNRFNNHYAPDTYLVEAVDALKPADKEAFAVLRYHDKGRMAAVASAPGRTFVLGFPFESLTSDRERERLMGDVLGFLLKQKKK